MGNFLYSNLKHKNILKYFHYISLTSLMAFGLITIVATGGGGGYGGGCNGGVGGSGTALSISNLVYSPESTTVGSRGGTVTVTGSVDFVDEDADVSTLIIDIFDSGGNQIEHISEPIQGMSGQTSGTIAFAFSINTSIAGDYIFEVYLMDTDDLKSNVITGYINIFSESDWIFQPSLTFNTKRNPSSVTVGDLDGDNFLDLVVSNSYSGTISVFLNNMDGTFATAVDYNAYASYQPEIGPVVLGDLNRDGFLDLAIAAIDRNYISILLNNMDGTFATAVEYVTGQPGGNPRRSVSLGDLDGDGYIDLAVPNESSYTVSVFLNNMDGTFAMAMEYGTGDGPNSVSLGDLDGDGYIDLAVANEFSYTVSVFLNNMDGTFATAMEYGTGDGPNSVLLGDLDGDSFLDLVVSNSYIGSGTISVFLNNMDGTFATGVEYGPYTGYQYGFASMVLGDLNGDGFPDLVLTTYSGPISVSLNNMDGTFATAVEYGIDDLYYSSIALGDLDGDGYLDLAATNSNFNTVSVFLNKMDGTFATVVEYSTGNEPSSVSLGDLDKDGFLDLVVVNTYSDTISVFLNKGNN